MKTTINTILITIVLTAGQFAIASSIDTVVGKRWQAQCKKEKQSLGKCCVEKQRECMDNAKTEKIKKACKKKAKACRTKTIKMK
ncbi:MAG: hypothetical protein D3925_01260 [Candidatus Electrothrix sp. AR5]|nr:hypothetical protein [Candidatus Electrothrix sp. AR5]